MSKDSVSHSPKSFTLIELILVVVVIGIAMPPLFLLFCELMESSAGSGTRSTAYQLAQDIMEEIKTKRWDETTPIDGGATNTPSTIGPDGELRADYDDVDDYNSITDQNPPHDAGGIPLADFSRFTRSVTVAYVEYNEGLNQFDEVVSSGYKRVTASVSWEDGSIEINTIVANY